ncbi:MAG TPA: VWA domain-containing protein [Terriglobales bacterium]|nr:VWA domain-containing protein [Terriglobales bacterium]
MLARSHPAGWLQKTVALCLTLVSLCASLPSQDTGYVFKAQTEIVLVNVTAHDKNGNLVRDLKREDFTVLEDTKPQPISSFDIENTDASPTVDLSQVELLQARPSKTTPVPAASPVSTTTAFKDRRLLIFFFDLSAMEPDETTRAVTSAQNYVDKQMAPADLVAVVSLGNDLEINQDFTSDKALLTKALNGLNPGSGQGFEGGTTGTTDGTADSANPFTADDTEYNIFNTDRRLEALRSISEQLAKIDQKKSLVYFSSGMDRTGIENQSELRAAINAAVRANLSIYTTDARGLQAIVPGGEAQSASMRGTSPFSGQAMQNSFNSNFSTQETLVTLAGDTGGKAFLDTNDFSQVFKGVQQDTSSYYILGYHSSNPARDGRYRRITVRVNRPGLKLDFRHGYYAPADFKHSNQEDREAQLEKELASDLPTTDLPVYLSTGYFRLADNRFYVPVSLIVPGKEIPFTRKSDQDKATLDVLGIVLDPGKRPVGQIRDTVKLSLNTSELVQRKNVQYGSGFVLPAGSYHLKFVVRENETGRIGSFETDLVIPDLKTQPLKMSSVVLASQLQPAGKQKTDNPLVRDGSEVIPSVSHVFTTGQHLYLYYEVYDPAHPAAGDNSAKPGIRLLTNVAFFIGRTQAYQTPLVEVSQLNAPDRKAAVFQLDVPLSQLKPGFYTCQVNVIDDAAGHFRFPRLAMLVRQ